MQPIAWLIFVLASAVLVLISRKSLSRPGSHGFYRFFAWEFMLILFIRNAPAWFANPVSWYQVISWLLLFISCVPVILGTLLLKNIGQPQSVKKPAPRQDEALYAFEKTTSLITTGIFQYIRHPMYSSLLLLTWGFFFKRLDWVGFGLATAASLFLLVTAWREEQENIRYFGPAYQEYMRHTRRFIPFLF